MRFKDFIRRSMKKATEFKTKVKMRWFLYKIKKLIYGNPWAARELMKDAKEFQIRAAKGAVPYEDFESFIYFRTRMHREILDGCEVKG